MQPVVGEAIALLSALEVAPGREVSAEGKLVTVRLGPSVVRGDELALELRCESHVAARQKILWSTLGVSAIASGAGDGRTWIAGLDARGSARFAALPLATYAVSAFRRTPIARNRRRRRVQDDFHLLDGRRSSARAAGQGRPIRVRGGGAFTERLIAAFGWNDDVFQVDFASTCNHLRDAAIEIYLAVPGDGVALERTLVPLKWDSHARLWIARFACKRKDWPARFEVGHRVVFA